MSGWDAQQVGAAMAWVALAAVLYVYIGYPVLLWLITRVYTKPVRRGAATPKVTLVISAFNEEQVIGEKIANTLALDYPRDLLEVIVVSDCSSDRTDAIAAAHAADGVKLLRMPERGGKTVGLNAALRVAAGGVVLFSDANILYRPDVVRRLVENIADPAVGCVTGDSRYAADAHDSAAHVQESTYWNYERQIRALESQLGSTVGGDGAIFAIRRELFQPLLPDTINDLVIPLQVVLRGYRAVFEPRAVGLEPSAGSFRREFRRKQRIVNRSWTGVMRTKAVLNPFRVGIFAWQVFSHKVLRWLVLPVLLLGVAGCALAYQSAPVYRLGLLAFLATVSMALVGALWANGTGPVAKLFQAAFYYYMVNCASVMGVARALTGNVDTLWSPERAAENDSAASPPRLP